MRFHCITFGCQMNAGDAAWLARELRARGWEEVAVDQAEVVVIATCSVREKPELKVYSLLGRLQEILAATPGAFVAVGGCVAQQVGEEFWRRFPLVRLVYGADGLAMAPQALERLASEPRLRLSLLDFTESYAERPRSALDEPAPPQAFVTIMQGCDNFCAYCIVPYVRGRQKSRDPAAVLAECRDLVARGTREITLLGQNVNAYGLDAPGLPSFGQLLRQVAALPGLDRLRFTTSHPKDLAPEVIAAFGHLANLCPQLHLPLQSGSDAVLARMGRKYDRARYLGLVEALRRARPDLALSTDFIVGFPGESETDFQATLDILTQVGFEASFSFKYNDRPGVRAAAMTPKVDDALAGERLLRLQALQDDITARVFADLVGTSTEVLFERPAPKVVADGRRSWTGHDPWRRVVNTLVDDPAGANDLTGRMGRVTIQVAKKHSLTATLAGVPW